MVRAVVQLLRKVTELSDFDSQMVYQILWAGLGAFKLGEDKLR
jgi:hypothetical protein